MIGIRKLMVRILGSRSLKIHSDFGDVIIRSSKNLEKATEPMGDLLVSWFVSLPWAYFETLFIKDASWNSSLLAILDNARVNNGKDCALISQAFCIWYLEKIIKNDEKYNHYSIKEIELWIEDKISNGDFIIDKIEKFRETLQGLPPDDWNFVYINEILHALYDDKEKVKRILEGMRLNLRLKAALTTFTTEMVLAAKNTN